MSLKFLILPYPVLVPYHMNRHDTTPFLALDVTKNEAPAFVCPFAQELGTLVSSTSLGRIASTRRRVSWPNDKALKGFCFQIVLGAGMVM